MVQSNQQGAQIVRAHGATACTDLTGFGLLGHLVEMTRPSGVDAELHLGALPLLDGAVDCVRAGIVSSLQPANVRLRRAIRNPEAFVQDPRYALLFDPQTAGGLLASVPASSVSDCIAALHAAGVPVLFNLGADVDLRDFSRTIGYFTQGGLGLPDRDYYLLEDERMKGIRESYLAYLEKMLTLFGEKPEGAKKQAADILALETRLAKASLSRVERRDPQKLYNRVDRKGLEEKAAAFPWATYFTALGLKDVKAKLGV
jgi:hypothetical protein